MGRQDILNQTVIAVGDAHLQTNAMLIRSLRSSNSGRCRVR